MLRYVVHIDVWVGYRYIELYGIISATSVSVFHNIIVPSFCSLYSPRHQRLSNKEVSYELTKGVKIDSIQVSKWSIS